jgi:hypothetical protein
MQLRSEELLCEQLNNTDSLVVFPNKLLDAQPLSGSVTYSGLTLAALSLCCLVVVNPLLLLFNR